MTGAEGKSTYVVELSVGPGGSRWAELHAYADPAHVRWVIERFCKNLGGMSAYHAIWYGAILGVWTLQRGEVTSFVDLHAFLTVELPGKGTAKLDDREGCLRLVLERRKEIHLAERANAEDGDDEEEDEYGDEDFDDVDLQTYEEMVLKADWSAVAAELSPLDPPLLASGERTAVAIADRWKMQRRSYLFLGHTIRFGSYDEEAGATLAGPVPFADLEVDE
ncbi:MAG: hypothetical protein QM820_36740 [Minicystis sp.]